MASGATTYSMVETDGNPTSVNIDWSITGDSDILVKASESSSFVNSPIVTGLFYQSTNCLIIATEAAEMTSGENINITFTFSEPVKDLQFSLFDVDGNDATEPGADREEQLIITAVNGTTPIFPTLITPSASNSVSGSTITGHIPASSSSASGNAIVSFFGQEVSSVTINFSIINIVGTPSASAEPGFGIANLTFNLDEALPVKLLSFDAYKKGNVAQLVWATASEQNNKGFEIERSTDGRTFTKIGFVSSFAENGNSSLKLDYNFTDNNPANGQNFYRLKQVDFDGKYEYSSVRLVSFDKENNINLYPNPATESVNIAGLQGSESIYVYDVSGRLVYQSKAENASVNIPLTACSKGTYHISIIGADGTMYSYKVVKH